MIGTFGISRDITAKKEAEMLAAAYAGEIKRLKEAMEEDVRMAGQLQKAFFPKRYPTFPPSASPGQSRLELSHFNESRIICSDSGVLRAASVSSIRRMN